jgi:hypothetical protein
MINFDCQLDWIKNAQEISKVYQWAFLELIMS